MKKEILEKLYQARKNLIVSGDISTGKTTSVLFPLVDKMIEQNESLMILDSKEEYINKYYKSLESKKYNIIILNFRDLDKSVGWNPLQVAYELYKKGNVDRAMDYLEKMAQTITYENSFADPFWSETASDFLVGVVLSLFEDAQADEINLNSVNAMIDGVRQKKSNYLTGKSDYLTEYFNLKDPYSQSYSFASSTILAPNETRESILSVARHKLSAYVTREKLNVLLNKTTFNFEDITKKPTAIFLIARDETKYLNSLVAMFIEQLFNIIIDAKPSNKFNFVLDNFDIIEKVNEFPNMLGSGVARGIKFAVATRSLTDLVNKYGNYIIRLSNQVQTANCVLRLRMNDTEQIFENECVNIEKIKGEVKYPTLNIVPIKIFNLIKYVNEANKKNTNPSLFEKIGEAEETYDIEEVVARIDKKIAELEEEERKYNLNKISTEIDISNSDKKEEMKTENTEETK